MQQLGHLAGRAASREVCLQAPASLCARCTHRNMQEFQQVDAAFLAQATATQTLCSLLIRSHFSPLLAAHAVAELFAPSEGVRTCGVHERSRLCRTACTGGSRRRYASSAAQAQPTAHTCSEHQL